MAIDPQLVAQLSLILKENPLGFSFLDKEIQLDPETRKFALMTTNGKILEWLIQPTEDEDLLAIQLDAENFLMIPCPNEKEMLHALAYSWNKKCFADIVSYIGRKENTTQAVWNAVMDIDSGFFAYVPIEFRTRELCKKALKGRGRTHLMHFPKEFLDDEMFKAALDIDADIYWQIVNLDPSEEVSWYAVQKLPANITRMKPEQITPKIAKTAVEGWSKAIEFVPTSLPNYWELTKIANQKEEPVPASGETPKPGLWERIFG